MSMGRQTTGEYITSTGGQGFDDGYVTNNYFGSSTAAQGKFTPQLAWELGRKKR